jgi:hypothetical protein
MSPLTVGLKYPMVFQSKPMEARNAGFLKDERMLQF